MKTLEVEAITPSNSEKLSALRDGQLSAAEALALVRASLDDESLVQQWRSMSAVSDVMRGQQTGAMSAAQIQLPEKEASPPQNLPPAANDGVFRWKMMAGLAAFAAVGSLTWGLIGQTAPAMQGGSLMAQANGVVTTPAAPTAVPSTATTPITTPITTPTTPTPPPANAGGSSGVQVASSLEATPEAAVMIRDPRLDELLAAHKQFGSASALHQPAGSLRSVSLAVARR